MHLLNFGPKTLSCGLLLTLLAAAVPLAAQPNRVTGRIDAGQKATVTGHLRPQAQAQFDRGAVDAALNLSDLSLLLKPSAAQQVELDALLAAQRDPASPEFHNWLTPEAFATRFGASQSDIEQITAWLESEGFEIHYVAPSRNWIAFGGAAEQAQRAFAVEIHRFQVNGQAHFAPVTEPSVPAALGQMVAGIRGLDDFRVRPPRRQALPAYTAASGNHYLAPDDVATIYGLTSLYSKGIDGTGQKIVVAGQSNINISDIEAFRALFNLTKNDPTLTLVPGRKNPGIVSGDEQESDLDLEWAGAVAKNASLNFVYSPDVLDAVSYAVSQNLAPVIALSYGGCETQSGRSAATSLRALAQQANAQGITWIASSGDSGAAGCDDSGASVASQGQSAILPASIPEVTAVGGTRFNDATGSYWSATNGANRGSALGYIPEIAWNDTDSSGLSASGGGPSVFFEKPSWQTGTGVPADGARDVPDVAVAASAAHDGALFCTDGGCANQLTGGFEVVGGTSLSAQLFAGMVALANQYVAAGSATAKSGLGNINPTLYAMASTYPDAFHDITSGNNIVPCKTGSLNCTSGSFGFQTGQGYDLVTGLGSVNAGTMAAMWSLVKPTTTTPPTAAAALASVAVSPATLTSGGSATVTVYLTAVAPTGGATVTLTSSSASLTVPASITVPAGLLSATGKATAGTATASASVAVTVSATYSGVTKTASVTVGPTAVLSVKSIAASPTSLMGGASDTVTVTLSAAAPKGGVTVTLASGNSTVFPLPSSITVPPGATSVTQKVQTKAVTASTPVILTATYNSLSQTTTVTLTPVVTPTVTSVTAPSTTIVSGGGIAFTVTLSGAAPPGGAVVTLSSSNTAALTVPATVTVAELAKTATFEAKTKVVTTQTPVTVTASYNSSQASATVTLPAVVLPTVASLAVAANTATGTASTSVVGGNQVYFTVTLSGAAPTGGASVTIASDNSALTASSPVTVAAGSKTATFSAKTSAVTANTAVTVTASYNSSKATANVTLTPVVLPTVASLAVAASTATGTASASVVGGNPVYFIVTLSGAAPSGGASVSLSSSASALTTDAIVTVPAGSKTAAFTAKTTAVTANTPVTVTASYNSSKATANVTLTPVVLPTVVSLAVTSNTVTPAGSASTPPSIVGGNPVYFMVTLSGAAPKGGAAVSLSSNNSALTADASVTVPAGSKTATFSAKTTAVTANTAVTVTASYNSSKATASITLTPVVLPALSSVSATPSSVASGGMVMVDVKLGGPAPPSGAKITLTTSSATALPLSSSLTVPSGYSEYAVAVRAGTVTASTAVTITASYNSASKTATVTVTPAK